MAVQDGRLCGFARCRNDDGFGLYVYDLLVRKAERGQNLGRALMDAAADAFPDETVYVMSDVDPYYEKQSFIREGSIFIVRDRG
ncbi:MAG: GNAT family N-acetyltransferase [Oscillospiraceae bacterium]|nr:GNAT family N-acetyltransferase [Oscillospiraceae bacterium]